MSELVLASRFGAEFPDARYRPGVWDEQYAACSKLTVNGPAYEATMVDRAAAKRLQTSIHGTKNDGAKTLRQNGYRFKTATQPVDPGNLDGHWYLFIQRIA